ncbi:MAG: LL-diaminopimelate aminotransferase [Syntrophorhabdus sp. PtaU1.Bin002]|nr:MAG: LL-diaminopimelate aminotransferase [Syntrophorhabdus sp. PtaB.Bin006]OPY73615.1 MAG: LL-diaminopimelate aminotransferase [Syntrophorhabdus sp. PtaU1.Bin002]
MVKPASRIETIPPYLFARIDKKKEEARNKGIDLIDFGIGDPDIPTPSNIIEKMKEAVADPKNHRYPSYEGMFEYRKAVADWYMTRFNVPLNPTDEIVALIGSKEGIAHMPWAYIEPGDTALIPSPGYPVYKITTLLAGGSAYLMPLKEENGFLPKFEDIPVSVLEKAKIMFLNYPNNPTGAHAGDEFYEHALSVARKYDILICHDAAYSEIAYDGYKPRSILEFDKEKKYSVEFHSLSKTYCMTGWRIGFVVGNRDGVQNLGKLKTNIDSGVFQAIQYAAIEALRGPQGSVEQMKKVLQKRRDMVVSGLMATGIKVRKPLATFYIWAKVPGGYSSANFCEKLIEEQGIVVTPGSGFGDEGEGYFRISITIGEARIEEAIERLKVLHF